MASSPSSLPSSPSQLQRLQTFVEEHISHICLKNNISIPLPLIWGSTNTPNIATLPSEHQSRNILDRIILTNNIVDSLLVISGSSAVIDMLLLNLMGITGEPAASRASIERLVVVDKMIGECVICMDEFGGKICKEMPCKHVFHGECIEKWLNIHGTCPVCRHKMPFDQNDEGKDKSRVFRLSIYFNEDYYDTDDIDDIDEDLFDYEEFDENYGDEQSDDSDD
ncbi:E3 ubiquitin-protein ligase RING1-like [Heracleum sosnowskyi]|uniref:RING-type E3 ubiquitin transferase n=1 Tax=Heracleum sosnowskyi TaxID=360622 RepID=A0AAD8MKK4_9APIA|nr:E3 ubiquitin-protein ligase RING1-like [Heracleum sosnowskyi]